MVGELRQLVKMAISVLLTLSSKSSDSDAKSAMIVQLQAV